MRKRHLAILLLALGAHPAWAAEAYRLSGPYTHDNLAVFLVHGDELQKGRHFLTLAQAMKQKKVLVHETGDVNQLSIENVSNDEVYVQAGEIVKGGRQDRTLSTDLILPKKSGKVPIAAFCVERGRWSKRKSESAAQFSTSEKAVPSKKLKMAARKAKDQGSVWKEVDEAQVKLTSNVAEDVRAPDSDTSLQLSLENGKVGQKVADYVRALEKSPDGKADVIGYAFAVNGQMNSAEVYGSNALFVSLWPKLLEASAAEALSEKNAAKHPAVTEADAKKLFEATAKAAPKKEKVSKKVELVTQEAGDNVMFETRDEAAQGYVHRSYY